MRDILYIYNVKRSCIQYEWDLSPQTGTNGFIIGLPSTNKNSDPNKQEFGFLKVDDLLSVPQPSTTSCQVPLESLEVRILLRPFFFLLAIEDIDASNIDQVRKKKKFVKWFRIDVVSL